MLLKLLGINSLPEGIQPLLYPHADLANDTYQSNSEDKKKSCIGTHTHSKRDTLKQQEVYSYFSQNDMIVLILGKSNMHIDVGSDVEFKDLGFIYVLSKILCCLISYSIFHSFC